MHFNPETIYHIYNQGNQEQTIFHSREHYLYFLNKMNINIIPRCKVLAWCLMPNHFNFLVYATQQSAEPLAKAIIPSQHLTEGIRLLLSSYTKGFNKQMNQTGNLFRQKTKAKIVGDHEYNCAVTAFHYIHQKPWRNGLTQKMEDWQYSSFVDYAGLRSGKICDKKLAFELLGLSTETYYSEAYKTIPPEAESMIF